MDSVSNCGRLAAGDSIQRLTTSNAVGSGARVTGIPNVTGVKRNSSIRVRGWDAEMVRGG